MASSDASAGQSVLLPSSAVSELAALESGLGELERARSDAHAEQLRWVRAFAAAGERGGYAVGVPAHLALALSCSEWRAHDLLLQAAALESLPGAEPELRRGTLTVEQWATVVRGLAALAPADAELVWSRLLARLAAERARGVAHPPARLAELLRRLIAQLLPAELAEQRRRNGTGPSGDDVTYDRNPDGSTNLHLLGVSAPLAQTALQNIAEMAQPWGAWDERTAGRRRLDAAVDLLTGRRTLPCSEHAEQADGHQPGPPERIPVTTCSCPAGGQVPCGTDVRVLVPLATALGLADSPAELVGHGALDTQTLMALLTNQPRLQPVFVDEHGVLVALGQRTVSPPRQDLPALRDALVQVAASPPGERFPVHPADHRPPDRAAPSPATGGGRGQSPRDDATGPHRSGPGPYTIRPRLRELLQLRTLRCEWPGCGARAARCDLDHDAAWPAGPTCACNLGALCRHHHRVKQSGWSKTRCPDGSVQWTSPTGRRSTSPPQLPPVPRPSRPFPDLAPEEPLPPLQAQDELRHGTPWDRTWDDADERAEPDGDPLRNAIQHGDTAWSLDLHDPYRWTEPVPLPDEPPTT